MRKSKQFISMPVISLEEGRQIGMIKELVVNPDTKRVTAMAVEQKGWFKEHKYIPYGKIHSVGDDAVTISQTGAVQKSGSLPEIVNLAREKNGISGARIVTESGTMLGVADDYYVSPDTGEIVGMEVSSSYLNAVFNGRAFLDIEHVLTIGKDMIVCSNEALENAVKLDGGLQEKFRGVRESTGHIWESTVKKTRELGSNVNKPLTRIKRGKNSEQPDNPAEAEMPENRPPRENPPKAN